MRITIATAVTFALIAAQAGAETITFSTSQGRFDAGIDNHGWWSDTYPNEHRNDNYFTGHLRGHVLRSFFTFDLSSLNLARHVITSATLSLPGYNYDSPDTAETLALFDVSTSAAVLNNNAGTDAAIFADLGGGQNYGRYSVEAYPFNQVQDFALNSTAIANIAAGAGSYFSIGGSLQSALSGGRDRAIFGGSIGHGDQRLILQTAPAAPIPEPGSLALLGTGAAGLLATGRRRRNQKRSPEA